MFSSSNTNVDYFPAACSLFFPPPSPPPPPDHMQLEYEDVYLQFLQVFSAPAADESKAKSGKKDRHSKINTARGPRDRRMRLSLDIARRFFRLQDLLGHDKASTTVQWLLQNAGAAIAELEVATGHPHPHESSTCQLQTSSTATKIMCRRRRRREKVMKKKRVAVGRESRRKARERARERTSQKRRLTHESHSHLVPIYDHHLEEEEESTQQWRNTSPLFTYHHHSPTFFNHEDEQIAEFEFGGKPWEAFNSFHASI